ncbi:MAG TPA: response regulator [Chryseosolibacter sp.]
MKESKKVVLYVEDDRDDQQLFVEVMESVNTDFTCLLASDGLEALDILKEIDQPICIYVDLNMPRMNGLEFLKALKLHPEYSHIPVFILTTSSSLNDEVTAVALGAKQYIVKPNSYQELFRILEKCCEPFHKLPVAKNFP